MIKNILLYGILLVGVLANAQSIALVSTKNNNYVTLENKTEQVQPNYIKVNDLNYQSFTKQFKVVLDERGKPELPYFSKAVWVPTNDSAVNFEIEHDGYTEIQDFLVVPSKGVLYRNQNPNALNFTFGATYQTNEFYPSKIAEVSEVYNWRQMNGVHVVFYPYQYNPVTKVLRIYQNVRVSIKSDNLLDNTQLIEELNDNIQNDPMYESQKDHFINLKDNTRSYVPLNRENGKLIVVAPNTPQYLNAISPLIEWKKQKGCHTQLITIESGTTSAQLKTLIQNNYNADNANAYLLLIGDHDVMPIHTYGTSGAGEQLYSDSFYGQLVGTDHYPEMMVGRLSGNATEMTTIVNKLLAYEKSPFLSPWMTNGIGIGSSEGDGYGDDGEADFQHLRNIRTLLQGAGWQTIHEFYQGSQGGADLPGEPTASMVVNAINDGVGLIFYTGHGWDQGVSTSDFTSSNVSQLTNANKYPLFVSVACNNGTFVNNTCIAEVMQRKANGGSVAFTGSSILQAWAPPMEVQDEIANILTNQTNHSKETMGGLFFNGMISMLQKYNNNATAREVFRTWMLFGDPTTVFRTKSALNFTAAHPNSFNQETTAIAVNCNVDGAFVSLFQNGVILGTGVVQNGMATINISNFSLTHVIKVTITKQNYLPYQGDIPFVLSTGIDSLTEVYFYPNPVKNILQFNNTNNAEVSNLEIFNQLGQKVFSQSAISSSLDLSVLKTGVYLISYEVNQTKVNSKLIKE
jgi:gingipain R